MDLNFNVSLAEKYSSGSQTARVLTENWVLENMFCPRCGNTHMEHFKNNMPVADFFCPSCHNQYELKSKRGSLGNKINDGSYEKMIERITGNKNPDFLFMNYSLDNMCVVDLLMIPKHFFTPDIIERRRPLSNAARRAGWTGCNILIEKIPYQGRIDIIKAGSAVNKSEVKKRVDMCCLLEINDMSARGWILDVLDCINMIDYCEFTLNDVYCFDKFLGEKHPDNHNIRPKIRQQLQLLRDRGILDFIGNGRYKKVF